MNILISLIFSETSQYPLDILLIFFSFIVSVQQAVAGIISSTRFNDTERVWIGFKRNNSNRGVFDWVDGTYVDFTFWYQSNDSLVPSEPSTQNVGTLQDKLAN